MAPEDDATYLPDGTEIGLIALPTLTMHSFYRLLIDGAGGPAERAAELGTLVDATFVPRDELGDELADAATRHPTSQGYFMELPVPARKTNQERRSKLRYRRADMVAFEGALVHPAVVTPLTSLMAGLRREDARPNDESALRVEIDDGWRGPTQAEGNRYLSSIRGTIRRANARAADDGRPAVYPDFPTELEAEATSELGFSRSSAQDIRAASGCVARLECRPGPLGPRYDRLA